MIDHINTEKAFKNPTRINKKNSQPTMNREELPQLDKEHLQ